jgi:RHS repeat-associated protein
MYHPDGQLARAKYVGNSEEFLWDGLALIRRNDEHFINEPHVGGGNPVASSKGTSYFNDMLGTTIGAKKDGKYSAAALTAFGERLDNVDSTSPAIRSLGEGWFTGKPFVEGLGHAFLMRNYRAGLAKWQTADPMGYPDGWNQLAYCNNGVTSSVDLWGCLGIVESEIQAAINKLVDGYVNASTIAGLLAGNSPTDCDDLEISGSIDVDIKSIEVVYSKEILGIQGSDCTTTWKRDPVNIPVGQKRERNLPLVYSVRNVVGDRAIGHFEGQISSFALSGMNLTVEDDGLIVDVHIKSIKIEGSFSFKVDLTYRNFIKE